MKECRHFVPEVGREIAVFVDSGDLDLYRRQFLHGVPFPETLRYLLGGPAPSRFVDIGANIGGVAFVAGALGMDVLAVEALSENFLLLARGVAANGLRRVVPCHAAASNVYAEVGFAGYSAWGHVPADAAGPRTVPVPAIPGDDLLEIFGFAEPELIKIDVEGHELQVLEGLSRTLERARPVLVMESNTWTRSRWADFEAPLELLRRRDYALFMYVGAAVKDDEDFGLQEVCVADYFCIPRERIGRGPMPARLALGPEERAAIMSSELVYGEAHAWHVAHAIDRFEQRFPGHSSSEPVKSAILAEPGFVRTILGHATPRPRWMIDSSPDREA